MGMGYAGNHAVIISDENLEKLCPAEYKTFVKIFESPYISEDMVHSFLDFGEDLGDTYGGEEDVAEETWESLAASLQAAWDLLADAFRVKTAVGDSTLSLYYGYHGSDDGDRYDDIQGRYWGVDQARVYTPAAEAVKDILEDAFFVCYG